MKSEYLFVSIYQIVPNFPFMMYLIIHRISHEGRHKICLEWDKWCKMNSKLLKMSHYCVMLRRLNHRVVEEAWLGLDRPLSRSRSRSWDDAGAGAPWHAGGVTAHVAGARGTWGWVMIRGWVTVMMFAVLLMGGQVIVKCLSQCTDHLYKVHQSNSVDRRTLTFVNKF